MTTLRAVLLVGSAKATGSSTSESLGRYLLARLEEGGASTTLVPVSRSRFGEDDAKLASALTDADLFVLATPLYVDSLPYLVTRTLESLAATRRRVQSTRRCAFMALVNCGFPESRHCQTAIEIAHVFARSAGFDWAGGLALGEGGVIDGRPLEELGSLTRHVRAALDLAAAALLEGAPLPAEASAKLARPLIPVRVYTFAGNAQWKRQARRNGVRKQLNARPFDR